MSVSVNNGTAFVPSPPTTIPGQILAYVSYNPATQTGVTTATTVYADVDATNLAVTFTVPASGNVEITLDAYANTNASALAWGIREATTNLQGQVVQSGITGSTRTRAVFQVTGLTPGASKTYKWSHARSSGSGSTLTYYGQASQLEVGPAVMKVTAL